MLGIEPVLGAAWVVVLPAIAAGVTAAASLAGLGYQIASTEGAMADARKRAKEQQRNAARALQAQRQAERRRNLSPLTWQDVLGGWRDQILGGASQAPPAQPESRDVLPFVLVIGAVLLALFFVK